MDKKEEQQFIPLADAVEFISKVVNNLELYKHKNVNKYYREKELEHGGEYEKMERYKNRTRVVDIFLIPLKDFLVAHGAGEKSKTDSSFEREIG
jgi:hypothetical protein